MKLSLFQKIYLAILFLKSTVITNKQEIEINFVLLVCLQFFFLQIQTENSVKFSWIVKIFRSLLKEFQNIFIIHVPTWKCKCMRTTDTFILPSTRTRIIACTYICRFCLLICCLNAGAVALRCLLLFILIGLPVFHHFVLLGFFKKILHVVCFAFILFNMLLFLFLFTRMYSYVCAEV